MTAKDVQQDLIDRMALLDTRHNVAFHAYGGDDPVGDAMYPLIAEKIQVGLWDRDPAVLVQVRAIVDPGDMRTAAFWQTPLGVLLFAAGGFPTREMPQSLAATVLGCSRQYVHELIVSGKLLSAPSPAGSRGGRMVDAEGVAALLRRKLDKLVK